MLIHLQDEAELLALHSIVALLEQQASRDANLRAHLAVLGHMFLRMAEASSVPVSEALTDDQHATILAPPTVPTSLPVDHLTPEPSPTSPPATLDDLQRLVRRFHGEVNPAPAPGVANRPARRPVDASVAVRRARLSRAAVNRSARRAADPLADEVASLAQMSTNCARCAVQVREVAAGVPVTPANRGSWLATIRTPEAHDPAVWAALGAAYDQVAVGTEILAEVVSSPELSTYQAKGLALVAEAQSALRTAAQRLSPRPEPNQVAIFNWLCRRTNAEQVYIQRFMRADDRADPDAWGERGERIIAWRNEIEERIYRHRHERKLLNKLRYQVGQAARGHTELWSRIGETLDALLALGVPPSSRDLRAILWNQRDALVTFSEPSRSLKLILRAWERLPKDMDSDAELLPEMPALTSDDVTIGCVAEALRGTAVVLIGGDERPHAARMITEAFELADLLWCDTRPHQSYLQLEPVVTRPEVSVVILAIRWASHGLGDVQQICERSGKPLIRLPGGYNVGQLAYQINQQASDRLGIAKRSLDR